MITVDLDSADDWANETDWQALAQKSAAAAFNVTQFGQLAGRPFEIGISVRLGSDEEVRKLNAQYRGKDRPTNILSFPMMDADGLHALANTDDGEALLGDMILAYETCAAEAAEKVVPLEQHACHLIIHGTLHLLGYDHAIDAEAYAMEALEIKALASLGLPNPYSD